MNERFERFYNILKFKKLIIANMHKLLLNNILQVSREYHVTVVALSLIIIITITLKSM